MRRCFLFVMFGQASKAIKFNCLAGEK